jgi:hypothetical protein
LNPWSKDIRNKNEKIDFVTYNSFLPEVIEVFKALINIRSFLFFGSEYPLYSEIKEIEKTTKDKSRSYNEIYQENVTVKKLMLDNNIQTIYHYFDYLNEIFNSPLGTATNENTTLNNLVYNQKVTFTLTKINYSFDHHKSYTLQKTLTDKELKEKLAQEKREKERFNFNDDLPF